MADRIPFEVYLEDTDETIILQLTDTEAERATKDNAFVLRLINQYNARRKNSAVLQIYETSSEIDDCMSKKNSSSASCSSALEADPLCISPQLQSIQSTQNVKESTENDKTLFMWSSKNVYLLLEKYEERMNEFSSGTKRHSKIWESIARDIKKVSPEIIVSGIQCQSKMNSMKKMYKKIVDHNSISGNDRKSWQYFERMDELFGRSGWAYPKATASEAGPLSESSTDENKGINEVPITKKPKSEKVLDEFMKQLKQDRQERETMKERRKLTVLQELKEQKEKQHKEKMDIMKKFCEAVAGKKLFD